jgi:hypothetical protein
MPSNRLSACENFTPDSTRSRATAFFA